MKTQSQLAVLRRAQAARRNSRDNARYYPAGITRQKVRLIIDALPSLLSARGIHLSDFAHWLGVNKSTIRAWSGRKYSKRRTEPSLWFLLLIWDWILEPDNSKIG